MPCTISVTSLMNSRKKRKKERNSKRNKFKKFKKKKQRNPRKKEKRNSRNPQVLVGTKLLCLFSTGSKEQGQRNFDIIFVVVDTIY